MECKYKGCQKIAKSNQVFCEKHLNQVFYETEKNQALFRPSIISTKEDIAIGTALGLAAGAALLSNPVGMLIGGFFGGLAGYYSNQRKQEKLNQANR